MENAKLISLVTEVFGDQKKISELLSAGSASASPPVSRTDDFLLAILIELKQLHHLLIPAKPVLTPELLDRLIDGKAAAKILNTCTKTVSRARENGLFTPYWIMGKAYYDPDQIKAFRRFFMK